jgi:hypothetical protein
MGFSRSWDEVGMSTDPTFAKDVDRRNYRIGFSQVLTKNMLLDLGYEVITDEGYLNNPYRNVWYICDRPETARTNDRCPQPEDKKYPSTRTSNAIALRSIYYLPYRAALKGEYRIFTDTWGIDANTVEFGYTHPTKDGWIFDLTYRFYTQNGADIYKDLFEFKDEFKFMARDKELSTFNSHSIGFGISYEFAQGGWKFIDKGSVNFALDHIMFDYDDFRDIRVDVNTVEAGTEPLYSFSANVMQLYFSIWY